MHGDRPVDGAFVGGVLVGSGVWLWPVCFQFRRADGWRTSAQIESKQGVEIKDITEPNYHCWMMHSPTGAHLTPSESTIP